MRWSNSSIYYVDMTSCLGMLLVQQHILLLLKCFSPLQSVCLSQAGQTEASPFSECLQPQAQCHRPMVLLPPSLSLLLCRARLCLTATARLQRRPLCCHRCPRTGGLVARRGRATTSLAAWHGTQSPC